MAKRSSTSKKHATPATEPKETNPPSTADVKAGSPEEGKLPIVGIGASAGGLAAFEAFLAALPPKVEQGSAFVFIQHLAPDHKSILTELVQRFTHMDVHEVTDGMEVKPNNVYIIPPKCDMALYQGRLQLLEPAAARGLRLPIDYFFRSLAADQGDRSIGIILSGTGSDGTLGIRAIKGEGGLAMAQTPESAEFDGMPRSVIATGLVDFILPAAEMHGPLSAYAKQFLAKGSRPVPVSAKEAHDLLSKVCLLLRTKTGHDFSQYKETTISRRVERRMGLHQIARMIDYLSYMQQNAGEVEALFADLLIGVTCFFRDTDGFATLENIAIPRLFEGTEPGEPVRVWVCGCSTGEEAYSIAILIQEYLEKHRLDFKVQIFATDIDRKATEKARLGIFLPNIAADVSAERLSRYFTEDEDGCFRIQKTIRDLLIFSEQDVLKDPPFSRIGLISCRNLLIYLKSEVQKRIIRLFHYALKSEGVLFLGNSETVGDNPGLYHALDRKSRLYIRAKDSTGTLRHRVGELLVPSFELPASAKAAETSRREKVNLRAFTEQSLLHHFSQAAVLVNGQGDILFFHGRTGNYLEPTPGDAGSNVISMSREGLRGELTPALYRAVSKKETVHADGIQVELNGHPIKVDVTVLPVNAPPALAISELYLIIFETRAAESGLEAGGGDVALSADQGLVAQISGLHRDLRTKDEFIQTIIEEMETSGEELKSSNEEMQSVNEEMQSTNEELETSREELQSVNEELATVNAELQMKVLSLSRANSDMNNLLAGTGVGTLFVDNQMRIARYTPSITKLINLIQTDIGRPLHHIADNLVGYSQFATDVATVVKTLVPVEAEAQTKMGGWYLLGIRPYRTLDNVIEGAVITFIDITERKLAQRNLDEAQRFRQALEIETVGVVFFDIGGVITFVNEAFLNMSGYQQQDFVEGKIRWDLLTPDEWMQRSHQTSEELKGARRTAPSQKQIVRKDGSSLWVLYAANRFSDTEVVAYIIDISENKDIEQKLSESEANIRTLRSKQSGATG